MVHWFLEVLRHHPEVTFFLVLGIAPSSGSMPGRISSRGCRRAVPTLGYGVAYAVGNVLLALWGTVIVALIA